MVSRTLLSAVGITVWTAVLVTAAPRVISHRHGSDHRVEMSKTHNEWPAASCKDLHIEFDGREGVMQSEEKAISKAEAATLRVQAEHSGGVSRGHPGSGVGLNRSHARERGRLDRRGKTKEGPYRPDDQQRPVDGPEPAGGPGTAAGPDLARGPGRTRGLDRAGWRNPAT